MPISIQRHALLAFILALAQWTGTAWAADAGPKLGITVPYGEIVYSSQSGMMKTVGRGQVSYGPYLIAADTIEFDRASGNVFFHDNIVLARGDQQMITTSLNYNYKTMTGHAGEIFGRVITRDDPGMVRSLQRDPGDDGYGEPHHAEPLVREFYFKADGAELKPNEFKKPSMVLRHASFSDCDRNPPCHDVKASSAEFSAGEKIELWNIRPTLGGLSYFYLPYVEKDLQYDWPWTRWELGSKADWGRYATVQTQALPGATKKRLNVGLDFREERGFGYNTEWKLSNEKMHSRIAGHLYDETWHSVSDFGPKIEQNRSRFDLFHRQRIDDALQFTAEGHHFTAVRDNYWSNGAQAQVSQNRHLSPFGAGVGRQERRSLFQEYFEDEYRRGRRPENSLALDHTTGRTFVSLSTLRGVDEEDPVALQKNAELRGRTIPGPIGSTPLLYSNDFGAGSMGRHVGTEVSDPDRLFLFGRADADDYTHTRLHLQHKVELPLELGRHLSATPYVGERTVAYESVLRKERAGLDFWNIDRARDTESWFTENRMTAGALFSSLLTSYQGEGTGSLRHQVKPSLAVDYFAPSGFTKDRIPVEVDELDTSVDARLKNTYRLENNLDLKKKDGERRRLYSSAVEYVFLPNHRDEVLSHGHDLREGANLDILQSFFPVEKLRLSNEVLVNTFHGQTAGLRNGVHYSDKKLEFGWTQVYVKDLRLQPDNPKRRHDFNFLRRGRLYDFEARSSWEESLDVANPTGLAKHGFRRLDLILGRRFHKLYGELELAYDIESAGSTVIFRFGPELFGRGRPNYRYPL